MFQINKNDILYLLKRNRIVNKVESAIINHLNRYESFDHIEKIAKNMDSEYKKLRDSIKAPNNIVSLALYTSINKLIYNINNESSQKQKEHLINACEATINYYTYHLMQCGANDKYIVKTTHRLLSKIHNCVIDIINAIDNGKFNATIAIIKKEFDSLAPINNSIADFIKYLYLNSSVVNFKKEFSNE